MFGLSTKEVLFKAILNASRNSRSLLLDLYAPNAEAISDAIRAGDTDTVEKLYLPIFQAYHDDVANSIFNKYQASAPIIFQKIMMCLLSPSVCGHDFDIDNGITASSIYAICYWATKTKVAPAKDCIEIQKLQTEISKKAIATYASLRRDRLLF